MERVSQTRWSAERFGHLVFDEGGVVWVRFRAAGWGEAEALIEADGCEVGVGDHELEGVGSTAAGPGFDCVDEETAGAGAALVGSDPHGHQLGPLWVLFVEEGDGYAAVVVFVCEVADGAGSTEIGGALLPVGFGELRFPGVGAAEGRGRVVEGAEADCFVLERQSGSDWAERGHE
jgi:hypothetical protein